MLAWPRRRQGVLPAPRPCRGAGSRWVVPCAWGWGRLPMPGLCAWGVVSASADPQCPGPQPDPGDTWERELALRRARHRQDRADEPAPTASRPAKGTSRGRGPRRSRAHRRRKFARHACAPRPLAETARPRCDRRVRDHTHRESRPAVAAVGSRVRQSQPNDAVTGTAAARDRG